MTDDLLTLRLKYGSNGSAALTLRPQQLLAHQPAAASLSHEQDAVRAALAQPLDFPPFGQSVLPDDRLVVVIERDTPHAPVIVAEAWREFAQSGLAPENFVLLQPANWRVTQTADPRSLLPEEVRSSVPLHAHDPTDEKSCAYLASTANGDRIYLSRELVDADSIVTIGPVGFDPVLGTRGGSSALFPGLSDLASWKSFQGLGHDELNPEDVRPLRQKVDEIGWLLGVQMSICVVPDGADGMQAIYAGHSEPVFRQASHKLWETGHVRSDERAELVIVAIPRDAAGHGWEQLAAGFDAGRRLVERNGRIVVLSQLSESPGPGLSMLREHLESRQALRPLRKASPPDLVAATRIALAADWANLSLLSQLPDATLEDLFLQPISSVNDVQRLLDSDATTAVLAFGQQCFATTGE